MVLPHLNLARRESLWPGRADEIAVDSGEANLRNELHVQDAVRNHGAESVVQLLELPGRRRDVQALKLNRVFYLHVKDALAAIGIGVNLRELEGYLIRAIR